MTRRRRGDRDPPEALARRTPVRRSGVLRFPTFASLIVVGACLLIGAETATLTRVENKPGAAALEGGRTRFSEVDCPAGSYRPPGSEYCEPCQDGVDYTSHRNTQASCFRCSVCREDQEQKSPCNRTSDTVCQCKPGTFGGKESPEACRTCQSGCPAGKVVETPCTPQADLECVDKESGGPSLGVILASLFGIPLFFLLPCLYCFLYQKRLSSSLKNIYSGHRPNHRRENPGHGNPPYTPNDVEAQDNDDNETLQLRALQDTPEIENEAGTTDCTPVEAECGQGQEEAGKRPTGRRKPLVPVRGIDPTEALQRLFTDFSRHVLHKHWGLFMQTVGLTPNEIYVIRTCRPEDPLCDMLEKWLTKTGRQASINTLLDALEKLEDINALQRIEQSALDSGNFIYEDSEANATY